MPTGQTEASFVIEIVDDMEPDEGNETIVIEADLDNDEFTLRDELILTIIDNNEDETMN